MCRVQNNKDVSRYWIKEIKLNCDFKQAKLRRLKKPRFRVDNNFGVVGLECCQSTQCCLRPVGQWSKEPL